MNFKPNKHKLKRVVFIQQRERERNEKDTREKIENKREKREEKERRVRRVSEREREGEQEF